MLEVALAVCVVVLVGVGAYLLGRQRGEPRFELGFDVSYREEEGGFWLWKSYRLYSTIQYKYRDIPVGDPVAHLVKKVTKVDEKAIEEVLAWGAAFAAKSAAPIKALHAARRIDQGKLLPGSPAKASSQSAASKATVQVK